jgi:16S rRNA (uracil1498-N3)-methyltransferase
MTRRRFYIAPGALEALPVTFGPREAHHIATVLRLRPGSIVTVFDGRVEADVELVAVGDARVTARVASPVRDAPRPLEITLLQGIPRGSKMDLVVRMGTEIGLTALLPVQTARSVPDPGPARLARWRRVAQEAARQCGRGDLPEIHPPTGLGTALETLGPVDLFVVPWEEEVRPLGEVIAGTSYTSAAILIGPEGGLTAEEVSVARAAGGLPASLGPLILRTETAALATAAMLLYERLLRPHA